MNLNILHASIISFQIIILLWSVCCTTKEPHFKRDHSLSPPYTQGNWDYSGATLITGNKVILTANRQSEYGLIWNTQPLQSPNWEIVIQFRVHGSQGLLYGDGLAFWYIQTPPKAGSVFGSEDKFRGLGVFLDTYSNHPEHNKHHEHPYINAMVNNGSWTYDHDTDGKLSQVAGCTCYFRNKVHDTFVSVRYERRVLSVSYDIENKQEWETCFVVPGVELPTGYYLALSAATGDLTDNHEIISLKTYELPDLEGGKSGGVDRSQVAPHVVSYSEVPGASQQVANDPSSQRWWHSMKMISVVVLVLVLMGAAAAVCALIYTRQQQQRQKRFY